MPYFTDPGRYVQWMGQGATLHPVPGGFYRVFMRDGVKAVGEFSRSSAAPPGFHRAGPTIPPSRPGRPGSSSPWRPRTAEPASSCGITICPTTASAVTIARGGRSYLSVIVRANNNVPLLTLRDRGQR